MTNARQEALAEAGVLDDPVGQLSQVLEGEAVPAQPEKFDELRRILDSDRS